MVSALPTKGNALGGKVQVLSSKASGRGFVSRGCEGPKILLRTVNVSNGPLLYDDREQCISNLTISERRNFPHNSWQGHMQVPSVNVSYRQGNNKTTLRSVRETLSPLPLFRISELHSPLLRHGMQVDIRQAISVSAGDWKKRHRLQRILVAVNLLLLSTYFCKLWREELLTIGKRIWTSPDCSLLNMPIRFIVRVLMFEYLGLRKL